MLVTCYYDLYGKPEKFMEYLYLFYELGMSGLPMVVFVEPHMIDKFRIFPSTVVIVGLPLADCELYRIAINYTRELPTSRNPEKDTKEFFALMNTKMELVRRAAALWPAVETFQWIDFGIMKIMKQRETVITRLRELDRGVFQKMTVPGCWAEGHAFSVDSIHWRFCGGFFILPRLLIERFYQHSKCVLTDFCTQSQYKLTWETNVWTVIESCAEKDNIAWYAADHNDTMVLHCPALCTF